MAERRRRRESTTSFLNVDLDVASTQDLSPLVTALGRNVFDLFTGKMRRGYATHLELGAPPKDADWAIRKFVRLLTALPPAARRRWDNARQRDFNIGIQGGIAPHAVELGLRAETLHAVARLRARIVVTVYAVDRPPRRRPRRRAGRCRERRRPG
jgi:hypothetical protein